MPYESAAVADKQASAQKSGFNGTPLTQEQKEKLHISQYYRPYSVTAEENWKDHTLFWVGKRVFDIICSALALVVLSPIILIAMLAIYIEDPHASPVFSQMRVGRDGKEFRFYKLRSMVSNAEELLPELLKNNEFSSGKAFKIKDDPRITKVGKVIRNTSIDELLQLVNVLKGDMSLVGPRPPLPREVALYDDYERQRLYVTPGLTCFWQVYPHRHEVTFDDWVALDIKYIAECNWRTDVRLIFATVLRVLHGKAD